MTAPHDIPPLPDAQAYLQGKDGVKALQHSAASLRRFAEGFAHIPLKPQAAERMVQLGDVMDRPEWPAAHDAAHQALLTARRMVSGTPSAELAAEAHSVQSIFHSQAVNSGTLKMIKHPELQTLFEPVRTYLEQFGNFVTGWVGIAPARIRPGEESLTPAAYRATRDPAAAHSCGDPSCTIDHAPKPRGAAAAPAPHIHGPDCGHGYVKPPARGIRHGGLWAMGAVGTVCVGAYLLASYGKPKDTKPKDRWTDQTASPTPPRERSL